jgi:hypothetical protein
MCGDVTQQRCFVAGYNAPRDPLMLAVYERKKRFKDIMNKMLYPTIDNKDMPMFMYLTEYIKKHEKFDTTEEILACMKKSGIPDKRYVSLHAFARRFMNGYKAIPLKTHRLSALFRRYFNMLESVFYRRYPTSPFFNYNWLLRRLLTMYKHDELVQFVKPIKCPKRDSRYEDMFMSLYKDLQVLDGGGTIP